MSHLKDDSQGPNALSEAHKIGLNLAEVLHSTHLSAKSLVPYCHVWELVANKLAAVFST